MSRVLRPAMAPLCVPAVDTVIMIGHARVWHWNGLRAGGELCSWNIEKAEGKLRKHAEWRRTFVPKGRIDEVMIPLDSTVMLLTAICAPPPSPSFHLAGHNAASTQFMGV